MSVAINLREELCRGYVGYHQRLLASARGMCGDKTDPEDLVQITVLSALENGDAEINTKDAFSYLNRILFRKFCDVVSVTSHKFRRNAPNLGHANQSLNDEDNPIPPPPLWSVPRQENYCYLMELLRIGKRELTPLEYEAIISCMWPEDDGVPAFARSTLNKARNRLSRAAGENKSDRGRPAGSYIGVRRKHRKYAARYSSRHIGYFNTAEKAARAYDLAALEAEGVTAKLNFPVMRDAA